MKTSVKQQCKNKEDAPRLGCIFLFLFLALGIFGNTTAQEIKETRCRQVGAIAESIAVTRDKGMSMDDAIRERRETSTKPDEKTIQEAASLLFHRFRLMSPEAAAFEFYMDCLDNQDEAN